MLFMEWALLVPFCIGICAVLQGGLNKEIGTFWGLSGAILLNSIIFMIIGTALFAASKLTPELLPESFRDRGAFMRFSWWYVLPGFLGFLLVAGIPWAIARMGALKVFVAVFGTQMVASMAWDYFAQDMRPTATRIICACTAFLSAAFLAIKG